VDFLFDWFRMRHIFPLFSRDGLGINFNQSRDFNLNTAQGPRNHIFLPSFWVKLAQNEPVRKERKKDQAPKIT
jgi:hypothetical protein